MGKYIVAISPRERQSVTVYCASNDSRSTGILSFALDFMEDINAFYRHKVFFDTMLKTDNKRFLKYVKRLYQKKCKTAISFTLSFLYKADMEDFVENFYEFLDSDDLY